MEYCILRSFKRPASQVVFSHYPARAPCPTRGEEGGPHAWCNVNEALACFNTSISPSVSRALPEVTVEDGAHAKCNINEALGSLIITFISPPVPCALP